MDISEATYEHLKQLTHKQKNKQITISIETINHVFDYVDSLQSEIDKLLEYIELLKEAENVENN